MSRIFLSFTDSDEPTVAFYEQLLKSAGHVTFRYDCGGLRIGDPTDSVISTRIREYDYIFVFLSKAYISRKYTIKELNQTVFEENAIGKIKMIIIRIDLDKKDFPRILKNAPFDFKNRFYLDAGAGMTDPDKQKELLTRISGPDMLIGKARCYSVKIPCDGLQIYHHGEKYNKWERNIPELLFYEGIGIYFLFDVYKKDLEFKNYIKVTESDYRNNDFTKILMDGNLKVDGSDVDLKRNGGHERNVFFIDNNYKQRKNGEFTNNVW